MHFNTTENQKLPVNHKKYGSFNLFFKYNNYFLIIHVIINIIQSSWSIEIIGFIVPSCNERRVREKRVFLIRQCNANSTGFG